jgi:hypothetical protein
MKEISVILILCLILGLSSFAQVGINASNDPPDFSAGLDINFTNKGLLMPRMNRIQRNSIVSPAEGLMVMCNDCSASGGAEVTFFSSGNWYIMPRSLEWTCGRNIIINHSPSAGVAPVSKIITYGTVTDIPGENSKCWITSNLGASQQALGGGDATEPSAGWYWQYNRKQGYRHDGTIRTPNSAWINSFNETSVWTQSNDPCAIELGQVWRIPTYTEWYNVDNIGGWGASSGAWNSGLKLHTAGSLHYSDGSVYNRGSTGYYWSSSFYSTGYGWYLNINAVNCSMANINKAYGFPVRCVRD